MSNDITDDEIEMLMREIKLINDNGYEPTEDELTEMRLIEEQEFNIAMLFFMFMNYDYFVDFFT